MDNKSSEFTTNVICAYTYTIVKPAGLQFTSIYSMETTANQTPTHGNTMQSIVYCVGTTYTKGIVG